MTEDDAELVALIDNELDETRRSALLARLAADEPLRQRYEELRATGAPLAAGFDALLAQAPLSRLRAALPPDGPVRQPVGPRGGFAFRQLAAGIVIGFIAAGAAAWAAWSFGVFHERGNWRSAVVDYANLYTNETFSPLNPDVPLQAIELSALGEKVGAKLSPESIALPGLRFTVAFMLSYENMPLGVIAYVDPSGEPVLLCIFANQAPDAPMRSERRGDMGLAWWSSGGRSHLVIGRIPEDRAVSLARMLEKRV
jgi:anti-sigma factor RsiW